MPRQPARSGLVFATFEKVAQHDSATAFCSAFTDGYKRRPTPTLSCMRRKKKRPATTRAFA
jgi:hypothetical protein